MTTSNTAGTGNPEFDNIISQLPLDGIAERLGTDRDTALNAVQAALPGLFAGMQNNATSPEGAASLREAVAQHDDGLLDGGVDLDQVDEEDGRKIVGHVLGDRQEAFAGQLSAASPSGIDLGPLVQKVLPLLAPLVMSYLAKKLGGQQSPGGIDAGGTDASASGGIDLGGLLGGMLGGAGQPGAPGPQPAGIDLGGILGGLFGRR